MKAYTYRVVTLCLLVVACGVVASGCSSPKPVDNVNPALTDAQKARLIDKKQKADQ